MDKKIIVFSIILVVIYVMVFIVPNQVNRFSLIPEKVEQGQYYRFFTYQFSHFNIGHLIKNIVGLSILVFILFELKTLFSDFSFTYITSGIFAIIPLWLLIPFTALGASTAIYSIFSLILYDSKKFDINPLYIVIFVILLTFIQPLIYMFTKSLTKEVVVQSLSHFSGFVYGVVFIPILYRLKSLYERNKMSCLRGGINGNK